MKKILMVILLFVWSVFSAFSQNDSIRLTNRSNPKFLKQQILPASLITAGSLLNIGRIKNKIQDKIPNTNIHLDDYFQYVPIGEIYLFDAFGVKHQSTVFDQTKYLI